MAAIKLIIAELRKEKGIGQQELAEVLGVSFQTVSKWETGATMPDITLLPDIAEYFNISVDQLLGIKPRHNQEYIPRNTDNHDTSNGKENNIYKNRKYFWNKDYLRFLINEIWKVKKPVDVIEFRCCDGYLGQQLLNILPHGSTYTGVDNEYFTDLAKKNFENEKKSANFIVSDIYSYSKGKEYDIAIIQTGLRHMNRPLDVLKKMISSVKKEGLIVCIDVNREFEEDGLYLEGIDYNYLCTAFDYHKIWQKELEQEGRDYAIGMRLPFYMEQLKLHDIDVRMNDRVEFVRPGMENYEWILQDFIKINGWDKYYEVSNHEDMIKLFMNRGLDRTEAEAYIKKQQIITDYFMNRNKNKTFLKVQGLLIAYGRK